jgi:hypothetical protein
MTRRKSIWIGVLPLTAIIIGAVSPTRSDEYPNLNVAPLCHGIVGQSSLEEGLPTVTFDDCIKAEQADREAMIKEWSTFSSGDRTHCIAESTMGGSSSYTELITCLEMARDVRRIHSDADTSPAAGPGMRPAPMGHRQPKQQ